MKPASSADSPPSISNYRFVNAAFLNEALTHKSYVNEQRASGQNHNERLEFLGDAVLSLIISDYLASRYTELSEGALSQLKAKLVSEAPLAKAARRLDLGARLKLGRGEELSKGREKPSLLADGLEAVIAAVYLDGGLEESRNFTIHVLGEELRQIDESQMMPGGGDYKTRFQEWCQKHHDVLPRYVIARETGPDHQKLFEVEVFLNDVIYGLGRGYSKKEAEQQAAQRALERVERGGTFPLG
ncbi:MAG: ribonuclease III [Nitrospira sp.]|nr:ribonuclease III [Nitrospira sp.]MDR4464246.1 ribonuclease III [Nitrospira sp.]MDR4466855.1 ribonuclease III [Nitrospira sp.]